MKKDYEILRIEKIQDDYKKDKKVLNFLTTFAILSTVVSVSSLAIIAYYNIPITTKNVDNKLLYLFGLGLIPISLTTGVFSIYEARKLRKFKNDNKEVLSKKLK